MYAYVLLFMFLFFSTLSFLRLNSGARCFSCVLSVWNRETMRDYDKKTLCVFMQARLCPPPIGVTCVFWNAGPQGLTNTQRQQANAACDAFCCLLTLSITEPQACFCPAALPSTPLMSRTTEEACSLGLPTTPRLPRPPAPPPGNHGKIRQNPASCSKRTS